MNRDVLVGAATAVAALGLAASAQAATVAGLVDGVTLVWIDTTAKKVTKTVPIQGGNLVGIDVRPADKQLYGVTSQAKGAWYQRWVALGLGALEAELAGNPQTGRFCHGDSPSLADCCMIPQLYNARRLNCVLTGYPTLRGIELGVAES
jgi:glutathione S-transferase